MKSFRYMALGLALVASAFASGPQDRSDSASKTAPVLVELFTSEGCSTCPPADEFLARLNREQPLSGITVIGVEEHVDYWNRQGWNDPYSSPEWTARQIAYVDQLKGDSAYTPQAIVDGQHSVIGAREREIVQAIQQSAQQPRLEMEVTMELSTKEGALTTNVRAGKLPSTVDDTVEIWLAIAEKDLAQNVTHGENAGRELRHSAVLRSLKKLGVAKGKDAVSFEGSAHTKLNREWRSQNLEVIVFAQGKKSKQIVGVTLARPPAA